MTIIIKKHIDYYPGSAGAVNFFSYPEGLQKLDWTTDISESGLDQIMHTFIKQNADLLSKAELILIPLSLTRDYINFTGLRLGMHIRLTPALGGGRRAPIVFMGDETYEQVGRISPLGSFLFTKGVDLIQEVNTLIVEAQEKWMGFKLQENYLGEPFLEKVSVQPPDFYDSKHTLSNELSLLYLDQLSGHRVLENKKELNLVKSSLYVKWMLARHHRSLQDQDISTQKPFIIDKAKGKHILLIDDEWRKGWHDLLGGFFQHASKFECLSIKKTDGIEDLESRLKERLELEGWDLFLLDIRLLDRDHDSATDFTTLSGFILLDLIKRKNRGNQVILFSASHQHEIYDYGKKAGADEIWIKPEVSYSLLKLGSLKNFEAIVVRCFDRKWFKDIFQQVDRFNTYLDFERYNLSEVEEELYDEIAWLLKGATQILRFETELSRQLFVLLLFKIIEECNDFYIDSIQAKELKFKEDKEFVKEYKFNSQKGNYVTNDSISDKAYNSARNRFFAVCHQKWGHELSSKTAERFNLIGKLGKKRNDLIHKRKAISELPLDENQLLSWLTALVSLLLRGN
jgi:CheY-like chemotaxis protein